MFKLSPTFQKWLLLLIYISTPALIFLLLTESFAITWQERFYYFIFVSTLIAIAIAYIKGLHHPIHEQNLFESAISTITIWASNFAIVIAIAFILHDAHNFPPKLVVAWVLLTPTTLILIRLILKSLIIRNPTNLLIIGNNYSFTEHERQRLTKANITLYQVIETPDFEKTKQEIEAEIKNNNIDKIVINTSTISNQLVKNFVKKELEGTSFLNLESFMEKYLRKYFIPIKSENLDYLNNLKHFNKRQALLKKVVDITAALSLFILTAPVMIYAAMRIKKESPGTILFKQRRVGLDTKEFKLIKFRSMHMNAEKDGAQFATKDDPRAYDFGQFMRKTRIDELPQAFNVLRGDLHFIGPRAERKVFTDELEKDIPYYNERHLIKPGITGWAQVNYPYGASTEDARQKLMYDLYYIKNWTLALEIETAWKTVQVVLGRQGI